MKASKFFKIEKTYIESASDDLPQGPHFIERTMNLLAIFNEIWYILRRLIENVDNVGLDDIRLS